MLGGNVNAELPYDLTIVTVCRNALAYLPRCLDSVQPLYDMPLAVEHLLIDGASSDGTQVYLAEQLGRGRITRFISEPDTGIYDAMNKGIRLSRGRVLVFVNADDEIVPAAVPACCQPILRGQVEYTVASALCIGKRGSKLLRPRMDRVLWRQPYCHQSMYCSRRLLLRMGGFAPQDFPIGADTDLMRRLHAQQVAYREIPVVAAHFYEGGASSAPESSRDVYELMLKFADACCAEIRRRPSMGAAVMKHLRRYANKRLMLKPGEGLREAETERLAGFVRQVVQGLSPTQRYILQHRMRQQGCWYALRARCASGRQRDISSLNRALSILFEKNI